MKNTTFSRFFASLVLTLIFLGALVGFALVDLSTARYMPGEFSSIFMLTGARGDGVELTFLGQGYAVTARPLLDNADTLARWRDILPPPLQLGGGAALAAKDLLDRLLAENAAE